MSFNNSGRSLCSGSSDGMVRVWRVMDGRCTFALSEGKGADTTVTCCAFNPIEGGEVLLCCGRKDGGLRLWSTTIGVDVRGAQGPPSGMGVIARGGTVVQTVTDGHRGRVRSVAFHSLSSDTVFSHGDDMCVRVWGISTGECLQVIEGGESGLGEVLTFVIMPGTGHLLLASSCREDSQREAEGSVQRFARGAFYFLASGSGGGKIEGLKPRDSGVRLVLISYDADSSSYTGLLCSAVLPGGHAEKVRSDYRRQQNGDLTNLFLLCMMLICLHADVLARYVLNETTRESELPSAYTCNDDGMCVCAHTCNEDGMCVCANTCNDDGMCVEWSGSCAVPHLIVKF